jgi:hypothetical protein
MPRIRKDEDTQKQIEAIRKATDQRAKEAEERGWSFTTPTVQQLRDKLHRARSPMIVSQGWSGSAPAGGQVQYQIGITNPDPTEWIWLFVHLFIGPGNMVPNVGHALAPVDDRFPRLTMPPFDGLTIASNATEFLDFEIAVPANVELSNYLGNSFLFQSVWHDPGEYIDRSVFVFEVV